MLAFNNAAGNLFNRLGELGRLISKMRSYQADQYDNLTNTSKFLGDFSVGELDLLAPVSDIRNTLPNAAASGIDGVVTALAASVVQRFVFRDNPQAGQSEQSPGSTLDCLREVVRQMKAQNQTVLAQTVAATATAFDGTGNAEVVVSVVHPADGKMVENALAENMFVDCMTDSYTGTGTAANEQYRVAGEGAAASKFNRDWPAGSGQSITGNVIDGASSNSAGNLLTNSGFENWDSNDPDNWTIVSGVAGTHIFQETSIVYDPAPNSAMRIRGDGSTLVAFKQLFGTDTAAELSTLTQYGFCVFMRCDGVAPVAGVMVVELVDADGTVVEDEAGTPNRLEINLTTLNTSYAGKKVAFRTPKELPSAVYLQFRMTTALTNNREIYIDKASLGSMLQAYMGGPFVSTHAGSIPLAVRDQARIAVTNSRGSGGSLDTWQVLWHVLFPEAAGIDLLLPSSANPTILDALIG